MYFSFLASSNICILDMNVYPVRHCSSLPTCLFPSFFHFVIYLALNRRINRVETEVKAWGEWKVQSYLSSLRINMWVFLFSKKCGSKISETNLTYVNYSFGDKSLKCAIFHIFVSSFLDKNIIFIKNKLNKYLQ